MEEKELRRRDGRVICLVNIKKKNTKKTCFEYDWVENDLKHKKERHLCHIGTPDIPKSSQLLASSQISNESEEIIDRRQNDTHSLLFFYQIGKWRKGMGKCIISTKAKKRELKKCHLRERVRINLGLHLTNWVEIIFLIRLVVMMLNDLHWLVWSIQNFVRIFSLLAGLIPAPLCAGPFLCLSSIHGPWGIHPTFRLHWQLAGVLLVPHR